MIPITDHIIYSFSWSIFHSIWQFIAVAMILKLILRLLNIQTPKTIYNFSVIALAICFILFSTTFYVGWNKYSSATHEVTTNNEITTPKFEPYFPIKDTGSMIIETPNLYEQISHYIFQFSTWIFLFWLLGIILFSIRFFSSFYFLNQFRKVGIKYNKEWQEKTNALQNKLGIKRKVTFLLSQIAEQPLTFGFFKPIILMPIAYINQISEQEVEALILHELSHIKRNDYLINLFQSIIEILFFYHPMVWHISSNIRKTREESCDDQVVAIGKDPLIYAQALLFTKKQLLSHHKNYLAMNATHQNSNHFTKRIFRIMKKNPKKTNQRNTSNFLFLIIMCICFLSIAACASLNTSKNKVVSISADKMNVLYIGVDNPITIAISNMDYKNVTVQGEDEYIKVIPQKEIGKYIVRVSKPGNRKIFVKGKNIEEEIVFRIKRVPDPIASFSAERNESSGSIGSSAFKNKNKIHAALLNFVFDATCEVKEFELTRVPKAKDPSRIHNHGNVFSDRTKKLIDQAATGDVYYFDMIKAKCPGDAAGRKLNSMVWQIK